MHVPALVSPRGTLENLAITLTGRNLISALTKSPFALLRVYGDGPDPIATVTPEQVMGLLESKQVVAIGSKNRVRHLQRVGTGILRMARPRGVFEPCWLNQQAAVLRFHDEAA